MLFTDVEIFGALTLVYLGLWILAKARYILYTHFSKSYNIHRALSLDARTKNTLKWGWLVYLTLPLWFLLFPSVTIITQNTQVLGVENITEEGIEEVEGLKERLLEESFFYQRQHALFNFRGRRLSPGNYIYNNTDSVLNLYYTEFNACRPIRVDDIEAGVDIYPGEIVRSPEIIDYYFQEPERPFTRNKRKDIIGSYTLDVKSMASERKNRLKLMITNGKTVLPWEGEVVVVPQLQDGQTALRIIQACESLKYIQVKPLEPPSAKSAPEIVVSKAVDEFGRIRREFDSIKSIYDRFSLASTQTEADSVDKEYQEIEESQLNSGSNCGSHSQSNSETEFQTSSQTSFGSESKTTLEIETIYQP